MNIQQTRIEGISGAVGRTAPRQVAERRFAAATAAVAEVAAAAADAVDREARFPAEAVAAAKREGLLGAQIPQELGGAAAAIAEIADVCYALGRACASTGMIFAMHQTKVACLVRHGGPSEWHRALMRRVASEQLLLASSTTEGKAGGDIRSSAAAVTGAGRDISLVRDATVISYGAEADGIVTTARRADGAAGSDQVLLAMVKGDYTLEPTLGWETLGMRGTRSAGFRLVFGGSREQIFPEPYERIHARTMTPVAHICWSSVWAGIAASAVTRAQTFVRRAARGAGGELPPGAAHFTLARMTLADLRALVAANIASYAACADDERALGAPGFQTAINLLKVQASELAVRAVMQAARACGLAGYRNDADVSVGRNIRDVLSAPIMINNDRILANLGASSLVSDVPGSIHD